MRELAGGLEDAPGRGPQARGARHIGKRCGGGGGGSAALRQCGLGAAAGAAATRGARTRHAPCHTSRPASVPLSATQCSDQLARCKDRLRVDIGHLSHDVYGIPELQQALVENPAEYLPIVRLSVSFSDVQYACRCLRWLS